MVSKILSTEPDGSQKVIARIWIDRNGKVASDNRNMLALLSESGIRGKDGKKLFPSDGLKFVSSLKYSLSGSRLRAT